MFTSPVFLMPLNVGSPTSLFSGVLVASWQAALSLKEPLVNVQEPQTKLSMVIAILMAELFIHAFHVWTKHPCGMCRGVRGICFDPRLTFGDLHVLVFFVDSDINRSTG